MLRGIVRPTTNAGHRLTHRIQRSRPEIKSIDYSHRASGVYISREMFDHLGIAGEVKVKSAMVPAEAVGHDPSRRHPWTLLIAREAASIVRPITVGVLSGCGKGRGKFGATRHRIDPLLNSARPLDFIGGYCYLS
jgi:hypothetical protein